MKNLVTIGFMILAAAGSALAGFEVREEVRVAAVRIDWQGYELQGRLFRPEVEGRLPLVVLAHGTCGKRCRRRAGFGDYMHPVARAFARSGYVAYAFNRLGYGGSEGYLGQPHRSRESNGGCNTQDYKTAGRLVAEQIRLVVAELVKEPFVDPGRVVVIGHSGGGLGAIALTEEGAPGLRGVISAAGARGGACAKGEYLGGHFYNENMTAAYQVFARSSTTPVLMLFAKNDPRTARAGSWRDAYAGAGGSVELVVLPRQRGSGHSLKRWDSADWVPIAGRFLEGLGLPTLGN
ncbi:MAG: dienelactone hydrolase family protein [Deltaproteobacteria bacterium]|nr:dienelactone hydrolase family protein [Deltaproteobacteria bacterium]